MSTLKLTRSISLLLIVAALAVTSCVNEGLDEGDKQRGSTGVSTSQSSVPDASEVAGNSVSPPALSERRPIDHLLYRLVVRGYQDFHRERGRMPESAQELCEKGYFPYLPTSDIRAQISKRRGNRKVYFRATTSTLTARGSQHEEENDWVLLKRTEAQKRKLRKKKRRMRRKSEAQGVEFHASKWEHMRHEYGFDKSQSYRMKQLDRLSSFIDLAMDKFRDAYGREPRSLTELENFIGLKRAPAVWNDLTVVNEKKPEQLEMGEVLLKSSDGSAVFYIGAPEKPIPTTRKMSGL